MPLIPNKSKAAFKKNVETEMQAHPGPAHRAQNLAIAYAVKKKAQKMAHGGMIHDEMESGYEDMPDEEDMVSKVMKKHMYAAGGMVPKDHEDELEHMADGKPNEFDVTAMEEEPEFSYTGENSGDYLGDEAEDHDREDIISKVMKSRAKKDRLPNPR